MASNLDKEVPAGGGPPGPPVVESRPTITPSSDETTRKWVAFVLLALLSAVVAAAFVSLFTINAADVTGNVTDDNAADASRLMSLMNVVFGPIVTLFSSVVGFYFGARTAKEAGGSHTP